MTPLAKILSFAGSQADAGCACKPAIFELAKFTGKSAVFCKDICRIFHALTTEKTALAVRLSDRGRSTAQVAVSRPIATSNHYPSTV
jgi:hypothetical protein